MSYLSCSHHPELQSYQSLWSLFHPGPDPSHHLDLYKAGLSHFTKLFSFYTKMPVEKKAPEMEKQLSLVCEWVKVPFQKLTLFIY